MLSMHTVAALHSYPHFLVLGGFWVTCGVKMISLHHGWGWPPPQTASLIHVRHIQSVWAHWYAIHGHTVATLHSDTHTAWLRLWGSGSLMWIKNDVITSWLRLLSYSNCLTHPYMTCTKCLSTLICFPLTSLVTALSSFTHSTRLRLWGYGASQCGAKTRKT